MNLRLLKPAVLAAALTFPSFVSATIIEVDFTVSGSWTVFGVPGAIPPYGLPAQPSLSGSVTLDNSKTGSAAFVGLDWTTGSKTWTLAEVQSVSSVATRS
jgi:hypothetical protein